MTRYYYYDVVLMCLPMKQWAPMILKKKTDTNIDCQSCENAIFPDPAFWIEINLIERVNLVSSE